MDRPDLNQWAAHYGPVRLRRQGLLRRAQQLDPPRGLQAAPAGGLDGDPESELLVELWSMGMLPAVWVQAIAAASNAAAPRPQMGLLADLGSAGQYRCNSPRGFRSLFRQPEHGSPKP